QEGGYAGTGPRAPPSNCHGSDGDGGACQRTPPHDLIAAFARRWLREQALAARVGHRAQGQEGGKASRNNRAVSTRLRRETSQEKPPGRPTGQNSANLPGEEELAQAHTTFLCHFEVAPIGLGRYVSDQSPPRRKALSFFNWSTHPRSGKSFLDNPTQLLPQLIPSSLVT
ncbi:hypothetical protein EI555_004534, partial [Monodon monoceros]